MLASSSTVFILLPVIIVEKSSSLQIAVLGQLTFPDDKRSVTCQAPFRTYLTPIFCKTLRLSLRILVDRFQDLVIASIRSAFASSLTFGNAA